MMETTMTEAERQQLIDAAVRDQERRRKREKRLREDIASNSDEAIRQRTDFDPFTGSNCFSGTFTLLGSREH
jgi:hypothetical protein